MNKNDRKEMAKAVELLEEAQGIIESLKDQEREKFDNMNEGLQQGERGQAIEQAAEALESAYDELSNVLDTLGGIE